MKTQISNLRSGSKNQVLNPSVDYSTLKRATSHNGHAGDNYKGVKAIWDKVTSENPNKMEIELFGKVFELKANWSLSRKSVSYFTVISNDFLEENFPIKASKTKPAHLQINFGTTIEVSNGKNSYMTICPSLIKIL